MMGCLNPTPTHGILQGVVVNTPIFWSMIPCQKDRDSSARVFALQSRRWEVSPFARIVPVFSQLATQHVIGVITASQGDTVMGTLEAFGLGSAISCVMGGELGTSK